MNDAGFNQWRDGDSAFRGVDMRSAPNAVSSGIVSAARNARFRFGKAETRGGITKFATIPPSYTFTWPIVWPLSWTTSFSVSLQGNTVFDDANGQRWIITVANGLAWKSRPGESASQVAVENEILITGNVFMEQCFDVLVMFRENNQTPLVMDDVDTGFHEIEQTPSGTGTIVIPNAESGEFISNRLFIPHATDQIAVSDIGDYTRYLPTFNALRANTGTGDAIVRLLEFGDESFVVFKQRSIMKVMGATGDLSNLAMSPITKEYGLVGKRAVVRIGKDVWFLSRDGIRSFGLTALNEIQPGNEPVSGPIQPLIERINWPYAAGAVAGFFDNRVYFAVPLDDSTTNNALLVYDFVTQSWNGMDDGSALDDVRDFFLFEFAGRERLLFMDGDGFVNLMEDGAYDDVWNGTSITRTGIGFDVTTRGYCAGGGEWKRFTRSQLRSATWNPRFGLSVIFNGGNRTETSITARTRSRSSYYTAFTPAYVTSNANGDHNTAQRQDYSVVFPLTGVYPNGDDGAADGLRLDLLAPSVTRTDLRGQGEFAQVRVTCDRGRFRLEGSELEAAPCKRALGTEA